MKGQNMNASQDVLLPIAKARESADQRRNRLTVVGAILTLLIILFLTAQWPQRNSHAERVTPIDNKSATENYVAFDYFSAQFGNPLTNNAPAERIKID
ncbi:MAG TPA: hypothetical protein VFI62_04305 [Burkholderiales bacterium]|nr:hypothetical protein [Burkholderiales bacterium]